ncbi:condensation domain-containing protein [Actinomadura sp. NEAU-AAG7]|uniref:condensation domain-containing protein n=1 Tax=Actinomadura sp. NEAU-AAG7 TaxID=2839640 RepID=UPI001BE48F59|nr:condensation domain-containing protein [Actinomadura sp. NEAU-AAG7]MBT2213208.1 hypothetical protein [Actinomadura sp. NEAU-AAG7]
MPQHERPANPHPIVHSPRPTEFPLSAGQERLWWHDRFDAAGKRQDHVTGGWRVPGPVDHQVLSTALAGLVQRHEILRTRFVRRPDGTPAQRVDKDATVPVTRAGAHPEDAVRQATAEPFDLSAPPLLRVVTAELDDHDTGVLLVLHHIITDRWSMDVIARDLFELYAAACAERTPRLPALAVQYGDYALWQRRLLESDLVQPRSLYWKRALAGYRRPGPPADRSHPAANETLGRETTVELSAESNAALTKMAWRARASPAIVVTAALCAALGAMTDRTDVVIGAIVSDRPRPDLQEVVGCFLNTVALRVDLSPNTLSFVNSSSAPATSG